MIARLLLALCFVSQLLPGRAESQEALERIGRDRPLLVPTATAPRARINDLEFVEHAGRTWLLAAASDKVVHRWEVAADGSLTPATPLRWPIFRGVRGGVYTLADLGDGRVAVAGFGAKTSQVSLLSIDGSAAPARLVDPRTAARQNVWALSADTRNRRLYVGEGASVGGAGLLLCWNYAVSPPTVTRCTTSLSNVREVAVSPTGTHVVVAGPSLDRTSWRIDVYATNDLLQNAGPARVAPVQPSTLGFDWPVGVGGLDWVSNNTWIAATGFGYARGTVNGDVVLPGFDGGIQRRDAEFLIRKGTDANTVEVSNPSPFPVEFLDATTSRRTTIAAGRSQNFPANANLSRQYRNRNAVGPFNGFGGWQIEIPTYVRDVSFSARSGQLASVVESDLRYNVLLDRRDQNGVLTRRIPLSTGTQWPEVTALAISPDGRFVAAGGPDLVDVDGKQVCAFRVRLWSTTSGQMVDQFPDPREGMPTGGPIIALVTEKQGKRDTIVYQTGVPTMPARDYFRIWPGIVEGQEDVTGTDADAAFDVKGKNRSLGFAPDRKQRSGFVDVTTGAFSTTGRGLPMTESFLSDGKLVIGPIYTSPDNPVQCAIKFFSGGRWYVAIGQMDGLQVWDWDQCAKGFGYRALARSFYGHDSQVSSIDVSSDGNQLYSASIDGTICGWNLQGLDRTRELGLTVRGTTITAVVEDSPGWYGGFQNGMRVTKLQVGGLEVPANALARRLTDPLPGVEHFFTAVDGTGKSINLLTPIAHDPLWTYYPRYDRETVMWTPEGFFETSALNGTETIEWIVNLVGPEGQNDDVVVMAGVDQDGAGFRDTDVLEDVFRKTVRAKTTIPPPPVMKLERRGNGWSFDTASAGAGRITGTELLLNGRIVKAGTGPLSVTDTELRNSVRTGRNSIAGIVETAGGQRFRRIVSFDESGGGRRPAPRVNFLGIAVGKAIKANLGTLPTVVADVTDVHDAMRENAAALRGRRDHPSLDLGSAAVGNFQLLVEESGTNAPTRANIESAFAALDPANPRATNPAQPNDITVVVLSSHGEIENEEYVFHATDGPMKQTDLSALIQKLPCRTLLVLDTCHSGAGAGDQIAQFARVVNGPMVLTACRPEEKAFFEKVRLGHGFFVAAFVEALRDKPYDVSPPFTFQPDANGDGWLSIDELARFTQRRTGELLGRFGPGGGVTQRPQVVPSIFFTDSAQVPVR